MSSRPVRHPIADELTKRRCKSHHPPKAERLGIRCDEQPVPLSYSRYVLSMYKRLNDCNTTSAPFCGVVDTSAPDTSRGHDHPVRLMSQNSITLVTKNLRPALEAPSIWSNPLVPKGGQTDHAEPLKFRWSLNRGSEDYFESLGARADLCQSCEKNNFA